MAAVKYRLGFAFLLLTLAVLLFLFSMPYLLWMLAILLCTAGLSALLLRKDAQHFHLSLRAAEGGQVGRPVRITLTPEHTGHFLSAGYVVAEIEIRNIMFDSVQHRRICISLRDGSPNFETALNMELCGEVRISCLRLELWDLLRLFSVRCTPCREVRTVIYPQPAKLELSLSRAAIGTASSEGLMQNRRGNDPSEIFDLREYVPGDDIRAIHWKLSCKTDSLVLRQASDPSHYEIVLLPDLGLTQNGQNVSPSELNTAAALTIALGEQLLQQGVVFCLAIPTSQGLHVSEVRSLRELHQLLPQWLGLAVQARSGVGLQVFLAERMEQYFTRMLIVSAGKYTQDMNRLNKHIGVTVVSTADDASAPSYTLLGAACEAVVLPTAPNPGESYRIIC